MTERGESGSGPENDAAAEGVRAVRWRDRIGTFVTRFFSGEDSVVSSAPDGARLEPPVGRSLDEVVSAEQRARIDAAVALLHSAETPPSDDTPIADVVPISTAPSYLRRWDPAAGWRQPSGPNDEPPTPPNHRPPQPPTPPTAA